MLVKRRQKMTSERNEQDRLLDELLKGCKSPEDILGKHGVLRQMSKRMVERALAAEMTEHLGYAAHERAEQPRPNTRNVTAVRWSCKCRAIVTARLSRGWCPSGSGGWRALTRK
jgi:ATP-dependent DNA ligase